MIDRERRNGAFARTRSGSVNSSRIIASVLVACCFILSVIWFVFVSGFWRVTEIQIQGIRELERGDVIGSVYDVLDHGTWKPWDKRNIFFVAPAKLASNLKNRFFAESVHVDKMYPNILRLIVKERQRRVIIAVEGRFLRVDTDGIFVGDELEQTTQYLRDRLSGRLYADASHPPIILVGSVEIPSSRQRIVDPGTIRRWIETYQDLLAAGFRFKTLHVDRVTSDTYKIAAEGNFDIILNLDTPRKPQIETFRRFLQTKPKQTIITEYVDVRFPGKVFFK